jgi:hypothetical protein
MIMFGGGAVQRAEFGDKDHLVGLNDMFSLTIDEDVAHWKRLGNQEPQPRVGASLHNFEEGLLLHGGWDPYTKETFEDTWVA